MLHLLHCSVQVILSLHMQKPYKIPSFLTARTSTSECAPSSKALWIAQVKMTRTVPCRDVQSTLDHGRFSPRWDALTCHRSAKAKCHWSMDLQKMPLRHKALLQDLMVERRGSKATELAWLFAPSIFHWQPEKATIWGHNLMRQVQATEMLGRAVDELFCVMHINGYPAVRNEMQRNAKWWNAGHVNTKQMEWSLRSLRSLHLHNVAKTRGTVFGCSCFLLPSQHLALATGSGSSSQGVSWPLGCWGVQLCQAESVGTHEGKPGKPVSLGQSSAKSVALFGKISLMGIWTQ